MDAAPDERAAPPVAGSRWSSGFLLLLVATAVSGGAGYAVTWIVGTTVSVAEYSSFAVFWSTLYIIVGALGGLQQEITRGTVVLQTSDESPTPTSRIAPFAIAAAIAAAVVAALIGGLGGHAIFGAGFASLIAPLVVGVGMYTLVAALSGSLYGVQAWRVLAFLVAADGVVRLVLILLSLFLLPTGSALTWSVVLPFPIVLAIALPVALRALGRGARLDAPYRTITRNTVLAIAGAAATALVVSGFPFLLRATSPGVAASSLGPVILGLTLVRAPLVVPFFALQSFLIVRFRESAGHVTRRLGFLLGVVVAGSAAIAGIAAWIGPRIIVVVFGPDYQLPSGLVFVMVLTSGLVGVLAVTGAAVIAASQHVLYAMGWAVAAVVTVLALLIPGDVSTRTIVALVAGPVCGLAVHVIGFLVRARIRR